MASPLQWRPRLRDYETEGRTRPSEETADHPLAPKIVETTSVAAKPAAAAAPSVPPADPLSDPLGVVDPLGVNTPSRPVADPLSVAAAGGSTPGGESGAGSGGGGGEAFSFVPWSAKKAGILQRYTTSESLQIQVVCNFLDAPGLAAAQAAAAQQQGGTSDRTRERLEQLDQTLEAQEKQMQQMSQAQYIEHIQDLYQQLEHAWNHEERVKSLKIAIQCAKVLLDTAVIKFYPSKFVIITEILDLFGKLVFDRLRGRCMENAPRGKQFEEPIRLEEVPEQARETARNWFYKIASIRELLPRVYVEMAILRCYQFVSRESFGSILTRLANMLRGIGDPLIASYARAYLARKGHEMAPLERPYLLTLLSDHAAQLQAFVTDAARVQRLQEARKLATLADYHQLFSPALDWLLQCVAHAPSAAQQRDALTLALALFRSSGRHGLLLHHVVAAFRPDLVAAHALELTGAIRDADETYPRHQLYVTLGVNLVLASPPRDQRLAILNDVWKVVTKLEDPAQYIAVAEVYVEYPLKHLSPREVNVFLGDVLRHVRANNAYEGLQSQLQSVAEKVLSHHHDFAVIFGMENFTQLLYLFKKEAQVGVNRAILESFSKSPGRVSDPLIINTLFTSAKVVHDSLNALSFSDEMRQLGRLLCAFMQKVDFGRDVERQLAFLDECRSALGFLDMVKRELVVLACALAQRTLALAQGRHNKKTASFVRACVAFAYITIPSMEEPLARLYLYTLAAQVALQNQCLPQADALLKSAVTLIQDVPAILESGAGSAEVSVRTSDEQLLQLVRYLTNVLLVAPGHPEHGPFYLLRGLLKVLAEYPWEKFSTARPRAYLALMTCLSALAQSRLLHHVPRVESNDTLFGGSAEYQAELHQLLDQLLADVLAAIQALNDDPDKSAPRTQARLALELYSATLAHAELTSPAATLAAQMYGLAKKNNLEPALLKQAVVQLKALGPRVPPASQPLYQDLLKKVF